ncbi:MAG: toxic anion resistance protein, partial [Hydrogeniiclostridium mannosilyticum]
MDEKLDVTPTLTLEPLENDTEVALQPATSAQPEAPVFDESSLSEQERKIVNDFAEKIELSNSNVILQYGSGAQKKIADFSENTLNNVRTKDLGEVGDMLSNVVTELKSFDVDEEEKGFFGFFKRTSNKLTAMKAKYDKAEANIDKIAGALENHQVQLLKDVAMLDKMYELNKVFFKVLSMYILA